MLFDETNSLVEIDAQDDDFELGITKKKLLPTHEESKYPEEGLESGTVSVESGQGLNQIEGSTAEPYLEQNQPITPETGSRTGLGTGSRKVPEPVSPSIQARVKSVSVDRLSP